MSNPRWARGIFVIVMLVAPACMRGPVDTDDAECPTVSELAFCDPQVALTEEQIAAGIATVDDGCNDKVAEAVARGRACEVAFIEGLNCLAELNCDQFTQWTTKDVNGRCHEHRANVEDACGNLPLDPHLGVPMSVPLDDDG